MKTQKISAEYLDHLGTDLTVCNAARASFGKESDWIEGASYAGAVHQPHGYLSQGDAGLIRFLATGYRASEWDELLNDVIKLVQFGLDTNNLDQTKADLTAILHAYKRKAQHWAPFAHPQLQIRISIPIFLARQFVKHQVGAVWSEESRRYISDEPGVWFPAEWHTRPDDVKQGAGDVHEHSDMWGQAAREHTKSALAFYNHAVACGVAPEEARTTLPLNMVTTVVWTGSLLFWSRVCNQRLDGHAQLAAQELAKQISDIAQPLFPVSWAALVGE